MARPTGWIGSYAAHCICRTNHNRAALRHTVLTQWFPLDGSIEGCGRCAGRAAASLLTIDQRIVCQLHFGTVQVTYVGNAPVEDTGAGFSVDCIDTTVARDYRHQVKAGKSPLRSSPGNGREESLHRWG